MIHMYNVCMNFLNQGIFVYEMFHPSVTYLLVMYDYLTKVKINKIIVKIWSINQILGRVHSL